MLDGMLAFAEAYLAVPTRPPAAPWAEPPLENVINQAFQLLRARLEQTELLIGYEGNACAGTGESAEDLLGITAVHPMREDAVQEFLVKAGAEMSVVQALVAGGQLVETSFDRHKFYSRRVKGVSVHE